MFPLFERRDEGFFAWEMLRHVSSRRIMPNDHWPTFQAEELGSLITSSSIDVWMNYDKLMYIGVSFFCVCERAQTRILC